MVVLHKLNPRSSREITLAEPSWETLGGELETDRKEKGSGSKTQ